MIIVLMVFESLVNPKLAEKKPMVVFLLGLIYSTASLFLANYVLPGYASLGFVLFITLFFLPLFHSTMVYEEEKDLEDNVTERSLLKQHSKAVYFFVFFFLGFSISFALWYVLFSQFSIMGIETTDIFSYQINAINQINAKATDSLIIAKVFNFAEIFSNNTKVMIFCILFSFIFGAGAVFILAWNSSVIGVALGKYVMGVISATTSASAVFFMAPGCAILRYMIHGIPEMIGFFVAGLAGGIISSALIKHDFGSEKFERILLDVSTLILIAIAILFIASVMEVFLTPSIMHFSTCKM